MASLILPTQDNKITKNDIKTGILRITVQGKFFFPAKDSSLTIIVNGQKNLKRFVTKINRSYILYLGSEIMEELAITPRSKIRLTKKSSDTFILENITNYFTAAETDNITFKQLLSLRKRYWESLIENPFPTPPKSGDSISMIKYFKRKVSGENHAIGPYTGISVFEAANRIASDLVIINGIIQLINKDKKLENSLITVRLGNKHVEGKGDFSINNKEGEAFNVASSFYKGKLRLTNKKWHGKELSYILVNADLFEELTSLQLDKTIIPVKDWDKIPENLSAK